MHKKIVDSPSRNTSQLRGSANFSKEYMGLAPNDEELLNLKVPNNFKINAQQIPRNFVRQSLDLPEKPDIKYDEKTDEKKDF